MSDGKKVLRRRIGDADVVRRPSTTCRSRWWMRSVFPEIMGQHVLHLIDRVYETGEPCQIRGWRLNVAAQLCPHE